MIGGTITQKDGKPIDGNGKSLSPSAYAPSKDVLDLFSRVQNDYTVAYGLQHRPFKEFDQLSLLNRARLDQESFAAFVGAEYIPTEKQWRWRGRKNTTRDKIISILAHMLSAMLFPYVTAINRKSKEDKAAAQVMQLLIEDFLKKAGYEQKFMFLVVSALVNPAVVVHIEYAEIFQKARKQTLEGVKIVEVLDEMLSGLQMHIVPIDELPLS